MSDIDNAFGNTEQETDTAYVRALGLIFRRTAIAVLLTMTTYIILVGAGPTTYIVPFTLLISTLTFDATKSVRARVRTKRGAR